MSTSEDSRGDGGTGPKHTKWTIVNKDGDVESSCDSIDSSASSCDQWDNTDVLTASLSMYQMESGGGRPSEAVEAESLSAGWSTTGGDFGSKQSFITAQDASHSSISVKPDMEKSTESDSDSDFVHLERCLDCPEGEDEDAVTEGMQCSFQSQSSISSDFQFVQPVCRPLQMPREESPQSAVADDNLCLDDVGDQAESDNSGVVGDESDLSSLSLSIGDLPLTAGVRVYGHCPNKNVNATLNHVALLVLVLGLGIGLGHFMGSVRESSLRNTYVGHLRTLQDDYLLCLKGRDSLHKQLQETFKIQRKWRALMNMWRQHYGELVMERARLLHGKESTGKSTLLQDQTSHIMQGKESLYQQTMEQHVTSSDADHHGKDVTAANTDVKELISGDPAPDPLSIDKDVDVESSLSSRDVTAEPPLVSCDIDSSQIQGISEDAESVTSASQLDSHILEHNQGALLKDAQLNYAGKICSYQEYHLATLCLKLTQREALLELEYNNGPCKALYLSRHCVQPKAQILPQTRGFVSFLDLFWPGSHDNENYICDDTAHLCKIWQNYTNPIDVPQLLTKSWQQMKDLTESGQVQDILNQVIVAYEEVESQVKDLTESGHVHDILNQVIVAYEEVENQVRETLDSIMDSDSKVEHSAETLKSFSNAALQSSWGGHFEHCLNLTRSMLQQMNATMQSAWGKAKSLSDNFFKTSKSDDPVQSSVKENVNKIRKESSPEFIKEQNEISDALNDPLDSLNDHEHILTHDIPATSVPSTHSTMPERHPPKILDARQNRKVRVRKNWDRPSHKQKISIICSSFLEQNEKHLDLMPSDLLEKGFFTKKPHKYKKKLKKLHGRISKLNEDILTSLDDDYTEDLFDDLEDFQEDIDKEKLSEHVKHWLSCQVQWWKGLFKRKFKKNSSLLDCSQYLFSWQLRTLCQQHCQSKKQKCKGKSGLPKPSAHHVAQEDVSTKDWYSKHDPIQQQHKQQVDDPMPPSKPLEVNFVQETGWPDDMKDSSNSSELNSDQSGMWYIHRGRHRQESLVDATWYIQGADRWDSMHHDPTWYLNNLRERSLHTGPGNGPKEWNHYDHVEHHLYQEHEEWTNLYHKHPKYKAEKGGKN